MLILKVHRVSLKQEDYKSRKERYYSPQNLDKIEVYLWKKCVFFSLRSSVCIFQLFQSYQTKIKSYYNCK